MREKRSPFFRAVRYFLILSLLLDFGCSLGTVHFTNENVDPFREAHFIDPPETQIPIASKNITQDLLGQVFGVGTAQSVILQSVVATQYTGLGGTPCDPYVPGQCPGSDPNNVGTADAGTSLLPMNTAPTAIRMAYLQRACDRLSATDAAVSFAISQVTDESPLSYPEDDDLKEMFDLFYTGQIPSADVISGLAGVVSAAQSQNYPALEAWRFVILTLCVSPGWQIL